MTAGDNDQIAGGGDGELGKDALVFLGVNFVGFREAFFIGKRLAVIDDDGGESGQIRDLRKALGHVAAAEDEGARLRGDRFDKNVQLAAADQAVVVGGVLAQAEIEV